MALLPGGPGHRKGVTEGERRERASLVPASAAEQLPRRIGGRSLWAKERPARGSQGEEQGETGTGHSGTLGHDQWEDQLRASHACVPLQTWQPGAKAPGRWAGAWTFRQQLEVLPLAGEAVPSALTNSQQKVPNGKA